MSGAMWLLVKAIDSAELQSSADLDPARGCIVELPNFLGLLTIPGFSSADSGHAFS